MKNKDFLLEVHKYMDDVYARFEEYQNIAYEILCEFDRICRTNNINYYLAYGTLLGAIRDSGQIPWDYDIDVQIKANDKERLLNALKSMDSEYYYAYIDNTKKYPTYCLRVSKKGYHFNAIHVDVFFLIGAPVESNEISKFIVEINKYCNKRLEKYCPLWFPSKGGKLEKMADKYRVIKNSYISDRRINLIDEELTYRYEIGKSDYLCCLARELFALPIRWYESTDEVLINGRKFMVPVGYKEILEKSYGDYKTYIGIDKRFEEFYTMAQIIEDRNNNKK